MESSADHSELVERINQLNILRESNATLRAESELNARKAQHLEAQVSALTAELEPAKEEARVSRALLEEKDKTVVRLEYENGQWKERNRQLLTKVGSRIRAHLSEMLTLIFISTIALIPMMSRHYVTRLKISKSMRASSRK